MLDDISSKNENKRKITKISFPENESFNNSSKDHRSRENSNKFTDSLNSAFSKDDPQFNISLEKDQEKFEKEKQQKNNAETLVQHILKTECLRKGKCILTKPLSTRIILQESLAGKYMTKQDAYNAKVINDIIYNENTHLVSVFKDYLIFDDISEFLKRFYSGSESKTRLPKVYSFYDKYSKVFPNYIAIPENKFMFKNIERKQRAIDDQQKAEEKKEEKKVRGTDSEDDKILNTQFLQELSQDNHKPIPSSKIIDDSGEKESQTTLMKSYMKSAVSKNQNNETRREKRIEEMGIHELLDKFWQKNSIDINDLTSKTFDIDYSVTQKKTSEIKKEPPKSLPLNILPKKAENIKPVQIFSSKLVHIKTHAENKKPSVPVPLQKLFTNIPLKELPHTTSSGSPKTSLNAKIGGPSRNFNYAGGFTSKGRTMVQTGKIIKRTGSEVYIRSLSSSNKVQPFAIKYEISGNRIQAKNHNLRSQSTGKKEIPHDIQITRKNIINNNFNAQQSISSKMLPSLDYSPMMKKEVLAQKYNTSAKKRMSSQITEGTKTTSKDEAHSKGDFFAYVNALKDPWVIQPVITRKNSGARLEDNSPNKKRTLHKKALSTDINIGGQLTMQIKGRNQQKITDSDLGAAKTMVPRENAVPDLLPKSTNMHSSRKAEQVYLQNSKAISNIFPPSHLRFKSEYLNSLNTKQKMITRKMELSNSRKVLIPENANLRTLV